MKFHRSGFSDFLIFLLDIVLIGVSGLAAEAFLNIFYPSFTPSHIIFLIYLVFVLIMLFFYEFYTNVILSRYEIVLSVVISVVASSIVSAMLYFFLYKNLMFEAYLFLIVISVFTGILLSASKIIYLLLIRRIEGKAKLLVLESADNENTLARKIKYSSLSMYDAWYILLDVNNPDEIDKIVTEKYKEYDNLFISPNIKGDVREYLISRAVSMGMNIYLIPNLYNTSLIKSKLVQFDDTPALKIHVFGLTKAQSFLKRSLDIITSLFAIILTSPIMLGCAIAIKLDSKGPVFYKQTRLTKFQRPFGMMKFRTMVTDAEKATGAVLATEDDPRITKVGRFLRKSRLDELPQFFNILFGTMSIVGPRPERPEFVEQYLYEIPDYDKRYFVKAGLTGMAQVYARYDTKPTDKVFFDMLYIRGYSLGLDLKLILLTVKIMFIKESSAGVKEEPEYQKNPTINRGID